MPTERAPVKIEREIMECQFCNKRRPCSAQWTTDETGEDLLVFVCEEDETQI